MEAQCRWCRLRIVYYFMYQFLSYEMLLLYVSVFKREA